MPEIPPIKVHITSTDIPQPPGRAFRTSFETYVLTANDPAQCILPEDGNRVIAYVQAIDNDIVLGPSLGVVAAPVNTTTTSATVTTPNPVPAQPAVPATGVAQQNVNAYPVQVVISANGATITNVSVNGITVGTAAGTYTVPAFGAISIAYSVAVPTWAWTDANPVLSVTTTIVPQPNGAYIPKANTAPTPVRGGNVVFAGATTVATESRVTVIATYHA